MELTMTCLREIVMKVNNLGGLLPVEATASGSLFVKTQIGCVGLVKPTFIIVELTPVHAHSDNSHTTVARDFSNIGYYTHVTKHISSTFCGDMDDQGILLLDRKCKRNIAHDTFLVRYSSMGECARAKSLFFDSQIDSLKPASKAASSGGFKILDQFYTHECSSSELGSGVVLAINDKDSVDEDKDSVDASKESLNFVMDELDNSLTDDQKLAFLEIAGNIKCGQLKMMIVEFDAVENDLCTEHMSGDDHDDPDLCLTKENTYKRKCSIFDTGAS